MPLFGARYFATMDAGIRMKGTSPCENDEEIGRDLNEAGRVRTLSLIGAPPVLVGLLSQPMEA